MRTMRANFPFPHFVRFGSGESHRTVMYRVRELFTRNHSHIPILVWNPSRKQAWKVNDDRISQFERFNRNNGF